jgi:hypothetical protein
MPDKNYEIQLNVDARIIVSIKMVGGRVVSFVVRLVARKGNREIDVARYDTAHGKPHLDLLGASGTLKAKHWLDVDSFEQALTLAIEDFKLNYEEYLGSR